MAQATDDNTTTTEPASKELRSKIKKSVREMAVHSRRPRPSPVAPRPESVPRTKKLNLEPKVCQAHRRCGLCSGAAHDWYFAQESPRTALEHYQRKVHECRVPAG